MAEFVPKSVIMPIPHSSYKPQSLCQTQTVCQYHTNPTNSRVCAKIRHYANTTQILQIAEFVPKSDIMPIRYKSYKWQSLCQNQTLWQYHTNPINGRERKFPHPLCFFTSVLASPIHLNPRSVVCLC